MNKAVGCLNKTKTLTTCICFCKGSFLKMEALFQKAHLVQKEITI